MADKDVPGCNVGKKNSCAVGHSLVSPIPLVLLIVLDGALRQFDGCISLAASSGELDADVLGAASCAAHPVGYCRCTLLGYIDQRLTCLSDRTNKCTPVNV